MKLFLCVMFVLFTVVATSALTFFFLAMMTPPIIRPNSSSTNELFHFFLFSTVAVAFLRAAIRYANKQ